MLVRRFANSFVYTEYPELFPTQTEGMCKRKLSREKQLNSMCSISVKFIQTQRGVKWKRENRHLLMQ